MKRTLIIPLMLVCCILCGSMTAYAAPEAEATAPPYVTTTEDGQVYGEFDLYGNRQPDPADSSEAEGEPVAESEPSAVPSMPSLYPADVREHRENGKRLIVKTYELSPDENPEGIARDSFERDGWRYTLTDITKKETAVAIVREHTEVVTINTETKDTETIIGQLSPTLEYKSEDGYYGILQLVISSLKVETTGTQSSSYTVSATREYPHLSRNDIALVPKTIMDNGKTLTLASVEWKAQNTTAVDYEPIADSYMAIAKYTATASKTTVTGYTTTAEYTGMLSIIVSDKTVYTAFFDGVEIAPSTPETSPEPTLEPEQDAKQSAPMNLLFIIIALVLLAVLAGGGAYFLFLRPNVKVFNLNDGKYAPIGRVRIGTASPVINLTQYTDKAATGSFILVLDKMAAKKLAGQVVTVNYGEKSFQHIVEGDGGEYQFEVDF